MPSFGTSLPTPLAGRLSSLAPSLLCLPCHPFPLSLSFFPTSLLHPSDPPIHPPPSFTLIHPLWYTHVLDFHSHDCFESHVPQSSLLPPPSHCTSLPPSFPHYTNSLPPSLPPSITVHSGSDSANGGDVCGRYSCLSATRRCGE